jgi:hypothetical protein
MKPALVPGTHLISRRNWYTHHGIYAGDGRVVHYAGHFRGLSAGPVEEISLAEFAGPFGYRIKSGQRRQFTREGVVRRARSRIGERSYHVLFNNCEHFCVWCVCGENWSAQTEAWLNHPWTTLLGMLRARGRRLPAAV